jgi:hypothetical protein
VLGGDLMLIARADCVFSHAMNATERELAGSRNTRSKKKARKSMTERHLLVMAYGDVKSEHDVPAEDAEEIEDATKTPMGKLGALPGLPRGAKKLTMAKYCE